MRSVWWGMGCFCRPMRLQHWGSQRISRICCACFPDWWLHGDMKAAGDQTSSRTANSDHELLVQVCLCQVLWTGCITPVVIHSFCSDFTIGSGRRFAHLLMAPFPCPLAPNADYHTTVHDELFGTSRQIWKHQLWWVLSNSQLLRAGHWAPHLQDSCFLSKTSWTTTTLRLFKGQMCCWCCKLSPVLSYPFLTSIRSIAQWICR